MFDWVKNINKPYPDFWKKYQEEFEKKSSRYVVLCLEKGNYSNAKPVHLASLAIVNNKIVVKDSLELTLDSNDNYLNLEKLINFIGSATLVGHKIYLEIEILNSILSKMDCGRLKNEVLDIEIMHTKLNDLSDKNFEIEDLLSIYKLEKNSQHSASDYVFSIALLFLKLKEKLGIA